MAGNNDLVVGAKFYSYSAFKDTLEKYQKNTLTQFVRIRAEKIPELDPLCKQFEYDNVRMQCKQGKRFKKAVRTTDQRPYQRSYKVECPVQLTLRLNRRPKDAPCLKITQLNLDHAGHEVSKQVVQLYPEQRHIPIDEVDLTVLESTTMKTSEQRKILTERHSVYNLQQKLGVGRMNEERDGVKCEAFLKDILAGGGHGEVGQDEEGAFQYCCFTTNLMKDMLHANPETLILDCTYKYNQYLYPCLTIMVVDGEGQGQPVFHAFVAREDKFTLEKCLYVFAQQYTTTNTSCFVVDKDMAETAAIGAVFPGVPVLLCHFHISQTVKCYLKGKLNKAAAGIVLDSFMTQVTTESENEFDLLRNQISQIVPQTVIGYFEENWWSKKHLWAACCNANVVHLHATTTKTLVSYHSKIKKLINDKYSLSNAMSTLMHFDHNKLTEANRKWLLLANCHVYDHRDQDSTSVTITKMLSRFGAQLVKGELELSRSVPYEVSEAQAGGFTVSYKDRHLTTTQTTCTCSTFGHFQIPCRHIFKIRKHLAIEIFDLDLVPARYRWSKPLLQNPPSVSEEQSSGLLVTTVPTVPFYLRTVEGRNRAAKAVCDRAASFLSTLGPVEFQQKLQELEIFVQRWSENPDTEVNSEHGIHLNVHSPPVS